MNLYTKTRIYLILRSKRVRNAFSIAYEGKLEPVDIYALTAIACVIGIALVIKFADCIDYC